MARWFDIGGPCVAADHYMLPAAERLPEVMSLIGKKQYFVVHAKAYEQVARYMDRLGKSEGWLVVADPDLSKPWDGKIASTDIALDGRTIHVITC